MGYRLCPKTREVLRCSNNHLLIRFVRYSQALVIQISLINKYKLKTINHQETRIVERGRTLPQTLGLVPWLEPGPDLEPDSGSTDFR